MHLHLGAPFVQIAAGPDGWADVLYDERTASPEKIARIAMVGLSSYLAVSIVEASEDFGTAEVVAQVLYGWSQEVSLDAGLEPGDRADLLLTRGGLSEGFGAAYAFYLENASVIAQITSLLTNPKASPSVDDLRAVFTGQAKTPTAAVEDEALEVLAGTESSLFDIDEKVVDAICIETASADR